VTAEELVKMAEEQGEEAAFRQVDVVTCATFGAMCSSGAFLNFGHSDPPIRMSRLTLNDVPASGGLAAVDTFLGATEASLCRGIEYGGAHVICDLISGKTVRLHGYSQGTDCYPAREVQVDLTLDDLNQAYLYNPRNCYQNYSSAINTSGRTIHTYMGTLLPHGNNVTYTTSGELSPLLKDPNLRTIGIGTRIFMAGAQGYVAWQGTQFCHSRTQYEDGGVEDAGATLALVGDMKRMNSEFIRGATMEGYGVTLYMGLGIPIPVLDRDLLHDLARPNRELYTGIFDYSTGTRSKPRVASVSYEALRSGSVEVMGKKVRTAPLSSLRKAREIAAILKEQIQKGDFLLQRPIEMLPMEKVNHPMKGGMVR